MFNRQGTQCKQCISGYGHAAFSDGVSCADCSKHRYMWILNLLLQLIFLTFLFLVITILQIKGTTCPLNIIITYSQLIINAVMDDSFLRTQITCYAGKKLSAVIYYFRDSKFRFPSLGNPTIVRQHLTKGNQCSFL